MNEKKYLNLAFKLIDQVHHVLGKYRTENQKLDGLVVLIINEGENHPTMRRVTYR